jgi:hypothetical protein
MNATPTFAERLQALHRGDSQALGQAQALVDRARGLLESDDPGEAEGLPEALLELVARDAAERRRVDFLAAAVLGPKALARLVKKELYRLKSERRPLELPRPASRPAAPTPPASTLPAYVSPLGIDGRRTFIAPHQDPRGFQAVLGELSDVEGLVQAEAVAMPRREYRKFVRELSHSGGEQHAWLETDLPTFSSLVANAREVVVAGKEAPENSAALAGMFPGTPAPAASRSWPALERAAEEAQVRAGPQIFSHPENARWLPSMEALNSLALRMDEVATSRIVADEGQRRQQMEAALDRCVEEYFTQSARALWAERLFRQADYFEATGRGEIAQLLAANARAMTGQAPMLEIPFARVLFQKALYEQTQAALDRLTPQEREKLFAEERERGSRVEVQPASPLIVPGR